MKNKTIKRISLAVFLLFAFIFVAKFARPAILKLYVTSGVGNCQKIPILCIAPETESVNYEVNKEYLAELVPYTLEEIKASCPKEFKVIKETISKTYYKKKRQQGNSVIYLLYQKPDFFMGLFPQLKKAGIKNDTEFVSRTMHARIDSISNLTDTFFVINKSIFTPDLGDQKNTKIIKFSLNDKNGFLSYNFDASGNYFDCNMFNDKGDFFKVYIKDRAKILDLGKALAIISTVQKIE